jgi:hypothetical protein
MSDPSESTELEPFDSDPSPAAKGGGRVKPTIVGALIGMGIGLGVGMGIGMGIGNAARRRIDRYSPSY